MKVVNFGSTYQIYQDDLKTFEGLPEGTYVVKFNPMAGFSLERSQDFVNKEDKIYGEANGKTQKVMNAFNKMDKSLGVILSGDKGIGKSLFIRLLAEEAVKVGMPVIVVNRAYKGIAEFLETIEQEVLVLFDEFEKVFDGRKEGIESQDDLLGLFDGMSHHKRIYAITVNELNRVSEYMLNRPGRFHYHFRFGYPDSQGIREYLEDKVDKKYHSEIKNAITFGNRIKLNYDCLRAVAFEINLGTPFSEAIRDLNILNINEEVYNVDITFENKPAISTQYRLDLFSNSTQTIDLYHAVDDAVEVMFNASDIVNTPTGMEIEGSKVTLKVWEENETYKKGETKVIKMNIKNRATQSLHYAM